MREAAFQIEADSSLDGGLEGKVLAFKPVHAGHFIDEAQIGTFLTDKHIGPFTGLSKRLADLDLYDEIYATREDGTSYFTPTQQAKLAYGMMCVYILRGETQKARIIRDDARNPLTEEAMIHANIILAADDEEGQHRFKVLEEGWRELQERESKLERKINTNIVLMDEELETIKGSGSYELHKQERDELWYRTQREIFGIALAKGTLDEVQEIESKLEAFPNRQSYEKTLHTTATIDYLKGRGYAVLEARAKEPAYALADKIGTSTREGRFGSLGELKKELGKSTTLEAAAGTLVFIATAAGGALYSAIHPGPESQMLSSMASAIPPEMLLGAAVVMQDENPLSRRVMQPLVPLYRNAEAAMRLSYSGAKKVLKEARDSFARRYL